MEVSLESTLNDCLFGFFAQRNIRATHIQKLYSLYLGSESRFRLQLCNKPALRKKQLVDVLMHYNVNNINGLLSEQMISRYDPLLSKKGVATTSIAIICSFVGHISLRELVNKHSIRLNID